MTNPSLFNRNVGLRLSIAPASTRQSPKNDFGSILGRGASRAADVALNAPPDPQAVAELRSSLHRLNMQVATAPNAFLLARAVGRYVELAQQLAEAVDASGAASTSQPTSYIPGGAVIAAAVSGLGTPKRG